ncbi:ribosome hibernation-promoting factor, HPF/YfiA family [Metaclostridioides mangenotii]|uniref:ribosome hibernation-promoting factor, HPF/YfiA family n=1 Tax=Metaclostridioides mangenotii TaxID=1540 RepID=UPI0026F19536|nr:ribosome-associated translation inhibitor RaiA [Clostridioides mangenotii]
MQIKVSALQMKMTDGIKGYIEEKLSKFEKYLSPESEVKVKVSAKKERQKVEVTINSVGGQIVRAEDVEEDLYAAIDIVCDKLNRQIVKFKNKVRDKQFNGESIRFENLEFSNESEDYDEDYEDQESNIVIERRKKFDMKPMSPEEAILQMELVGHNFYIFTNQDTFEINVVYKRKYNGYGLIEQE